MLRGYPSTGALTIQEALGFHHGPSWHSTPSDVDLCITENISQQYSFSDSNKKITCHWDLMEGLEQTVQLSMNEQCRAYIELTKKVFIVLVVLVPKLVSSNQRPCPQVTKSEEKRRDKWIESWLGGIGVKMEIRYVQYIWVCNYAEDVYTWPCYPD